MENKKSEPLAGLSFGYILRMQDAIADQIDHFKNTWEQSLGASSEGKLPVIFLGSRYTVITGGYTPEEIREAILHIQSSRKKKADNKLVGETALNDAHVQPGTIQSERLGNANITSNYSIRVNDSESEKRRVAGMISVKGSLFRAQAVETKVQLSGDMREAVADVVNDTIRNALRPGGLLWNNRGR
ncbi:hypothetical protein [Leclercia adecarboxylata]|uniref:hypothetical protein n=1 Tax=Leclercia adecarboxylata TaxID=83655 RepID=UPI002B306626|nr:hypothetical protein NRF19_18985 [Leclercia adecarboxylata]